LVDIFVVDGLKGFEAMKLLVLLVVLASLCEIALAQPGTKTQIDLKARVKGTTEWRDVVSVTAASIEDTIDIEVAVLCYRNSGYGFGISVQSFYISNWLPDDVATLADRPDSALHPDGRQGNFNFGNQAQGQFTTSIDAGRLRIAAAGNTTDAVGSGIAIKQNSPVMLGTAFNTADGVLVFQTEIKLKNPIPGSSNPRTLVCNIPIDRVNSYAVYQTATATGAASIRSTLIAPDVATINVEWPACFALASASDAAVCPFAPAEFSVMPEGDGPFTYQWQFKVGAAEAWTDLVEGANLVGGKYVLSAVGTQTSGLLVDHGLTLWPTGVVGEFRCSVKKACGNLFSVPSKLSICGADLNCDGFVTADDFDLYSLSFDAGESTADYNGDGFVNGDDFDAFAAAFQAGC